MKAPAFRQRLPWLFAVSLVAVACGTAFEPSRLFATPVSSTELSDDAPLAQLPRGSLAGLVVDESGKPTAIRADVAAIGSIMNYEPDGGVGYGVDQDGRFFIPRLAAMTWTVSITDLTKEPTDPRYVTGTAVVVVRGGETARVTIVIHRP
jgi:hypothetical protein